MSASTEPVLETDIVVIGGGGSGLAAAIEAADAGCKVILLEKEEKLGGTTGRSVGSITASGTRLQKSAGVADNAQAHFEDMPLFAPHLSGRDNLELRRLLVDNVPDVVAWLERLGVVFFGPMPEPPHRVPRMHNILPSSKSYIHYLEKEARRLGVNIILQAKAEKLRQQGVRVTGVEASIAGRAQGFRARRAVILASGDMSSSHELKQKYLPEQIRDIEGINTASTGDGQRLGIAVGGCLVNGDIVYGPEIRFVAPPAKKLIEQIPPTRLLAAIMKQAMKFVPSVILRPFFMMFVTTNLAPSHSLFQQGAIMVNKAGRRFVDENNGPQYAIPSQPDRVAFIVFDENIARKYTQWPYFISTAPGLAYAYLNDYRKNRRDIFAEAPTLDKLARKLSMNATVLEESVAAHNDAALRAGKPALSEGPFYALGPVKSWIPITEGGLAVDLNLRVLDQAGAPIAGLYAAGSSGQGGLILEGHGHHLAWAFTSGRLAGRHAAASETV
jgi:succinate dehydrogenase/fumarate reductase flavoprotein subunit